MTVRVWVWVPTYSYRHLLKHFPLILMISPTAIGKIHRPGLPVFWCFLSYIHFGRSYESAAYDRTSVRLWAIPVSEPAIRQWDSTKAQMGQLDHQNLVSEQLRSNTSSKANKLVDSKLDSLTSKLIILNFLLSISPLTVSTITMVLPNDADFWQVLREIEIWNMKVNKYLIMGFSIT